MPREAFRAMGVDVVVAGDGAGAVWRLFHEWDRVFSRFRTESELSRVNRSRSPVVVVSPLFARAVRVALEAAERTGGLVDPTLGRAIEAAGYDRDFSELGYDRRPPGPPSRGSWEAVSLAGRLLTRPPGLRLDLNGVVKALAVDEALGLVRGHGHVAAGGDIAARGPVTVGLPGGGSIRIHSGGVATSSTRRRMWFRGGLRQHHLIDPRTGRPSESRWTRVTVAAASCLDADVAAKAALLLSDDGPDWLEQLGLPGLLSDGDDVVTTQAWRLPAAA